MAPVPKEDPVSIFASKIGDADVEFLMQGAWRATLSFSEGLRFNPDGSTQFPFGFPGFTEGLFFEQVPSLTFSIWLAHRWFLETSVVSRFEDNTILLGYRGLPGELVQKVLLGNKDARIGSYDFIDLPSQSKSSLGASALFSTPVSSHELLLRFDSTRQGKKVFYGKGEVVERELKPSDLLAGRAFMLPDAAVDNLSVYLEDKNGAYAAADGHRYRQATANEIFHDNDNGILYILIDHQARLAVHYTKGANTIGDAALGSNALPSVSGSYIDPAGPGSPFNWGQTWLADAMAARQLFINGQTCLLLWEPGKFSPFEMMAAYDLGTSAPQDLSQVRIKLIPKGDPNSSYTLSGAPVSFNVTPGRTFFVVTRNSNIRSDFHNHYPFPDSPLAVTRIGWQIYGPTLDHVPPFFDYSIFTQTATGNESYTLETGVVPGSVSVLRNGIEETRFTYDENSNALTFSTPIYPYDRLEVSYRVSQAEKNAGDIVFGWGNKFPFAPLAALDLALGLRWNILPGAYSQTAWSKTGAIDFSAALSGQSEHFSYRLSGALSYSNPDTSGVMRLAGMEGNGLEIEPSEDLGAPCAPPDNSEIAGLTILNRGRLLYKNYRQYDALGGSQLMPYNWTVPADQVWGYTNGSKPGPYLVAGDSRSAQGQSLVLDFELPATGSWVGIQLPVAYRNGTPDLSRIRSIIASLRAIDITAGSFDVYIQLGATGEDTEVTGILEAETSELSGGYPFHDSANGVILQVGGGPKNEGNGVINTEDIDGNGGLDAEDASLVFTSAPITFAAATGWTTFTLPVLNQNQLRKARALRIIVVNSGAGATNARLLVDKLFLAGSSFWSNVDAGSYSLFNVEEVSEGYAGVPQLASAFPEVATTFHNSGSNQEALQIQWAGGSLIPASGWTVKTALGAGVEGIRYRRLEFYAYRDLTATTGDVAFSLRDVNGKGVDGRFPAADLTPGVWQKVSLDLTNGGLSINDTAAPSAVTAIDPAYGSLVFWSLSLANTSVAGTMLVDEVNLRDPESSIGAAAAFNTALTFPGTLLAAGDVPILSNFSLTEKALARTAGFSSLYSRPQTAASFRSLSNMKAGILFAGLEAEVLVDSLGDVFTLSGGHLLTLPRTDFPVVFTDRFSERTGSGGIDFSHENTLRLNLPKLIAVSLLASAFSRDELLTQNWTASLVFDALTPYALSLSAQLFQSAPNFNWIPSWYLPDWTGAYVYLAPWTGGLSNVRNYKESMSQMLVTQPLGVKLSFTDGFGSYDIAAASHHQRDDLALSLSFPINLAPFVIEPFYARTLSALATVAETGSVERDLAWHYGRFAAHSYFFTLAPLWEIFAPDANAVFLAANAGAELTDYKPEIGLSVSRQFGSSFLDLLLPAKVAFSYGKEYMAQGTLFNAFERMSGSVLFNAVNLFGAKGTYRLTDLYAIDSFATSWKAAITFRENRRPETSSLSVESAYSFESAQGDKLVLRNLFSVDNGPRLVISDKGGLEWSWIVAPKDGISLPLIDEKTAKTGRLVHKESAELQFTNRQESQSVHPVNIVLKHETAIDYPTFGYLRGEAALGFDEESYPEQGVWKNIIIVGLRLTLELSVKF